MSEMTDALLRHYGVKIDEWYIGREIVETRVVERYGLYDSGVEWSYWQLDDLGSVWEMKRVLNYARLCAGVEPNFHEFSVVHWNTFPDGEVLDMIKVWESVLVLEPLQKRGDDLVIVDLMAGTVTIAPVADLVSTRMVVSSVGTAGIADPNPDIAAAMKMVCCGNALAVNDEGGEIASSSASVGVIVRSVNPCAVHGQEAATTEKVFDELTNIDYVAFRASRYDEVIKSRFEIGIPTNFVDDTVKSLSGYVVNKATGLSPTVSDYNFDMSIRHWFPGKVYEKVANHVRGVVGQLQRHFGFNDDVLEVILDYVAQTSVLESMVHIGSLSCVLCGGEVPECRCHDTEIRHLPLFVDPMREREVLMCEDGHIACTNDGDCQACGGWGQVAVYRCNGCPMCVPGIEFRTDYNGHLLDPIIPGGYDREVLGWYLSAKIEVRKFELFCTYLVQWLFSIRRVIRFRLVEKFRRAPTIALLERIVGVLPVQRVWKLMMKFDPEFTFIVDRTPQVFDVDGSWVLAPKNEFFSVGRGERKK
jgi:hypothetical protein